MADDGLNHAKILQIASLVLAMTPLFVTAIPDFSGRSSLNVEILVLTGYS